MPPGSDAVLSAAASFIRDKEVTDNAVTDDLGVLREKHRTVFLARAFGIDANGNPVDSSDVPTKKDRSAKSVEVHKEMIRVLTNWGNDDEMKNGTLSEEEVENIRKWRKNNSIGYAWCSEFTVESIRKVDGSTRYLLIKHRTRKGNPIRGLVLNYLEVFDAIDEVHRSIGHLRQEATLVACKPKYYSVTQHLVKIYCECCYTCMKKNPTIPPRKGAKNPILSCAFRDRFQVDLIDMRKMQRKDIYGVMQRWIMTIKDHSTGLMFCIALPNKRADFVAHELEKYFGLVGYPHIFHTDNGKEFTASVVADLLKVNNPNCAIVTGCPRTPRDQGSVESANKILQRILKSIQDDRVQAGLDDNWTSFLGQTLDLPQLLHVTYPKEKLFPSHCKKLQSTVSRVVAVMHNNDHYAVMEVDIKYMFIKIYDGLNRPLLDYQDHVLHALKKCMLADREDTIIEVTINKIDYVGVLGHSRQATKQVSSYSLDINSCKWRLDRGHFIQQTDGFNCGPIACLKIMELYHQISIDDVQLAYSTNSSRRMVIDKWIDMVTTCNDVLRVSVAEKLGGGSMTICFCCVDSPSMDIIRTPCCKNNVHRHCILRNMTINSQCVYCRKVLKYQVITDCPAEPRTTTTSPAARKRTMVDDTIHKEEATPLREADRVRQHSQEKRRLRQITQGNKMIRTQAQSIAKLGASPGAVVTVKVDHRAVSHAYGVVGVIMELTCGGAAKVATEAGILCHGIRKTIWWIPSDQYSLQYKANEQANIPDELQKIRDAIINGTDHDTLLTHTTIQVAHQKAVGASSPCVRGKCGCKDGKCGGRCGCIKAGKVCTSACSCNGNCKNNPKN